MILVVLNLSVIDFLVQYRVESMMLRIAKPLNYIAVSPGVQQRSRMRSPECIPLTLEPKSDFYNHPVVVSDFQSLYPSIMIAYNYCFSTCLGRIEHFSKLRFVIFRIQFVPVEIEIFLCFCFHNIFFSDDNLFFFPTAKVRLNLAAPH